MEKEFSKLKDLLTAYRGVAVFNPWTDVDELDRSNNAPEERWHRLRLHLSCDPKLILIGEAPSWRGQRFGGIAFCSERLLHDGAIPRLDMIGQRITMLPEPVTEMSATIVWKQLYRLGLAEEAVCWNAFAWHPHRSGKANTNRTPTPRELLDSLPVLSQIISMFRGAQVVAVGQVAASALDRLKVFSSGTVRHPAFGGAAKFSSDLLRLRDEWAQPFATI